MHARNNSSRLFPPQLLVHASSSIDSLLFYHPQIDRSQAERLLIAIQEPNPDCLFYLLRPSQTLKNSIVLTSIHVAGAISHIAIEMKTNGACYCPHEPLIKDSPFILRDLIMLLTCNNLGLKALQIEEFLSLYEEHKNKTYAVNDRSERTLANFLNHDDSYHYENTLQEYCYSYLKLPHLKKILEETKKPQCFLLYVRNQEDFNNRKLRLLAYDASAQEKFKKAEVYFQNENDWLLKDNKGLEESFFSFDDLINALGNHIVKPSSLIQLNMHSSRLDRHSSFSS
jgi:hypothetical protein